MGKSGWIGSAGVAVAMAAGLAAPAANAGPAYVTVAPQVTMVAHAPLRTWVPGHWEHRRHGNVWVQGHWVVGQPAYAAPQHGRHAGWHGGRRFDQDRDGIANRHDRDIDGDGVPNWRDHAPRHPYRR